MTSPPLEVGGRSHNRPQETNEIISDLGLVATELVVTEHKNHSNPVWRVGREYDDGRGSPHTNQISHLQQHLSLG